MKSKIIITSALLITISLATRACGLVRNSIQTQIEEANFRTDCANRKSAYLNAQRRQADSIPDGQGFVEIFTCINEHTKQLTVAFEGEVNKQSYFGTKEPGEFSIRNSGSTIFPGTYTVKFLTQGRVWQKGSLEVKPKSHIRFVVDVNEQTVQVDNSTVWKPNLAIEPDEAYDLREANRLEQQDKYQKKIANREEAGLFAHSVCNDLSSTNVENNNQYQNGFDLKPDWLVRLNFVSCTDDSLTVSVEDSKGEKILTEIPLEENVQLVSYDTPPGVYKIQLSTQGKVVQKGIVEVAATPSLWMVFNSKEQTVKVNTPHVWKPNK
ncbi:MULTISPECIES: hypothetical protein [unclassified Coleofasciculus]|uniref:hypothetical protein n=1 Tax=unclassified Coleofasciculus TaxID=2692782 RepID=UPI00187FEAC0|nr:MULTISPECIES: hypothetical protein [unclassified Coleofasciculus]MBE9126787.1 hypothetical protein [Coleofasciculus sp. LEGE 07081]MBE9150158.1 hypothetical protein [Coleofasciculus sp. LEGE 07092]